MEKRDEELIESLSGENPELKKLMDQHKKLGQKVDELSDRPHLSTEEEMEKKKLQKLKLAGRDRIEAILSSHRKS